jgi:asparagine synthase (glutamine-hydrolysing)
VPNSDALWRLPEAIDAMAEPMFGQDAVGFYLLGERVSREIKVVQSGQGADEVFGGYFWYPRIQADAQGTWLERFRRHYFDRDHEEYLHLVSEPYRGEDHSSELIDRLLGEPDADEILDAVLRMDVTTLIVDDPVKRVDNMTMAWGLEARVPFLDHALVELAARCPPALKLREGGKFPLKAMARGLLPDAVIDRPKGYFPMPALKYVRGDFLDLMRDLVNSRACRKRGLYSREYLEMLLSAPDMHHTRIQGNKLWHLALVELWLQRHVDALA